MRTSLILAALLTLPASIAAQSLEAALEPREKAELLNKRSVELLGVSLLALSMLLQSDGGSFLLEDGVSFEERGAIHELEKAGLAEVTRMRGLPDGQEAHNSYLMVRRTPTGDSVVQGVSESRR